MRRRWERARNRRWRGVFCLHVLVRLPIPILTTAQSRPCYQVVVAVVPPPPLLHSFPLSPLPPPFHHHHHHEKGVALFLRLRRTPPRHGRYFLLPCFNTWHRIVIGRWTSRTHGKWSSGAARLECGCSRRDDVVLRLRLSFLVLPLFLLCHRRWDLLHSKKANCRAHRPAMERRSVTAGRRGWGAGYPRMTSSPPPLFLPFFLLFFPTLVRGGV